VVGTKRSPTNLMARKRRLPDRRWLQIITVSRRTIVHRRTPNGSRAPPEIRGTAHNHQNQLQRFHNCCTPKPPPSTACGESRVLKGHDFSRAANAIESPLGFRPRGKVFRNLDFHHGLSSGSFLKKEPPFTELQWARELWNRSNLTRLFCAVYNSSTLQMTG